MVLGSECEDPRGAGRAQSSLLAERGVTRREAEVLAAVTERLTNATIAERLYLSERTVESHVSSLLRKLGATNRVELGDLGKEILAEPEGRLSPPLPPPLALLADPRTFVGRQWEMDELRDLWHRAEAELFLVVVVGERLASARLVSSPSSPPRYMAQAPECCWARAWKMYESPTSPSLRRSMPTRRTLSLDDTRRRDRGRFAGVAGSGVERRRGRSVAGRCARACRATQMRVFKALHDHLVDAARDGLAAARDRGSAVGDQHDARRPRLHGSDERPCPGARRGHDSSRVAWTLTPTCHGFSPTYAGYRR